MSEKSPISIDEIVDCKSILKAIRRDSKSKLIFTYFEHKFNKN